MSAASRQRFASLRGRVLLVLALAAVVPTVIVGALAVYRARVDVEREVVRGRLALVRALGAGLDATLQDTQRALSLTGAAWAEHAAVSPDATERLLRRLRRELPLVRRVAVLDPDGRPVAGDAAVPLASFTGAGGFGGFVGEASVTPDGATSVVIWAQARGRTGALAGYLAAEIDLSFIAQSLRGARLPAGAELYVVDASGRRIASSAPGASVGAASPPPGPAVTAALAAADDGSLEQAGLLAVYRNLSSFQTTRGVGWAIVLEQPTASAYALAAAARRDTILVGGAVLLLALVLGAFLARALARPLTRLTARVDAVGDSDAPPAPLPPDLLAAPGEIGQLARRFDEMGRRLGERDRLKDALARGERLASVGALAAGVAHEINNPLTTILGYATLLMEDKPEGHADRAGLSLVAEESRRVQGIVRGLLDYSRAEQEGGAPRGPVDLRALCDRTAALLQPTLRTRRIELLVQLDEDLPSPPGDARRLQQVWVNLAQNAAQAMEAGGRITIRGRVAGPEIVVEFVDQGPGIAPELLGRIFEPFFTTKGPGMGTGLGLAVTRQIVTDHRGRLEVDSEVGHGSTFRVILPA